MNAYPPARFQFNRTGCLTANRNNPYHAVFFNTEAFKTNRRGIAKDQIGIAIT
jgi:hypothetical protein